jgi:twinkle protein
MAAVSELLLAEGIRLRSWAPGSQQHTVCPKCEGGKTREQSLSVHIDETDKSAQFICHRGTCGFTGSVHVQDAVYQPTRKPTYKAPPPAPKEAANKPDWLYEWFDERAIGARVVDKLGIYAGRRWIPGPGEVDCIVFPYVSGGQVVNRKYRSRVGKAMAQEKDALPTLYNIDAIEGAETVAWAEGEADIAALMECGIDAAVTLKDGAPANAALETDPDAKRFAALKTHSDILSKVKRFVLAGDMDKPGLALREELARRLGRHRCATVTWPEGCKDAGDVLKTLGPDAVLEAIQAAEPYPVEGVQTIRPGVLLALRNVPPPATMTTGTRATDQILKLPTEGRLVIVTGYPGSGKTSWTRFVMAHTASNHGRRWAVFSPEMQPWETFVSEVAEVWAGKPFWGAGRMSDEEVAGAERWMEDRIVMLVCDAETQVPSISWIVERATACALRFGITDLLIDPWNEADHSRPAGVSETEHIGLSLQRLKAFALRHGCNVWVIAHPAKPAPGSGNALPPGPYDISSSAHWYNKADIGITVHSPGDGRAEIHLWKARFSKRWGKKGSMAALDVDVLTGRYSTPASFFEAPPSWHDTQ